MLKEEDEQPCVAEANMSVGVPWMDGGMDCVAHGGI